VTTTATSWPAQVVLRHAEHVMGTVVSFDVRADETNDSDLAGAIGEAVAWLHRVDAVFSTYRPDSQIERLARGELGIDECDADVALVFALCDDIGRETAGFFSARFRGRLDPTGIVKGWAVEHASRLLAAAGSTAHSVNGGGDVQTFGEPEPGRPWRVGIAHPLQHGAFAGLAEVRGLAVATSGSAERGDHIIDPFTGRSPRDLLSVTVVGANLTRVDAYATAALAMGQRSRAWLEQLPGYEGFAVSADGTGWSTSGFPAAS
jgi:thiamine biosynthesis lipoprotein